jgi:DNA-binding transcriptional regulator YdaS (Cro superfamily)
MTAAQLRAALTRLNLSRQAAVRLLGCDPTDLGAWVRGDARVPAAIVALLHLLIEGTISTADVGSAKVVARSRPSPGIGNV